MTTRITPCLWFNGTAEEAVNSYTKIFKNSEITKTKYFTNAGQEHRPFPAGSVMSIQFTINSTPFTALNGGPHFTFNEAISFQVLCEDQEEVDYYWEKLGEGGDEKRRVCGWIADRWGVSWQIIPKQLEEWIDVKKHGEKAEKAMKAMLGMKKLDIEGLRKAFEGEE